MYLSILFRNLQIYRPTSTDLDFCEFIKPLDDYFYSFLEFVAPAVVDKDGATAGRWRDANGKFITMPDILQEDVRGGIKKMVQDGNRNTARRLLQDISKSKLLQLTGKDAYKATVEKIKRKYRGKSFELGLISALQIESRVKKKAISDKLIELQKILKETKEDPKAEPANQIKLKLANVEIETVKLNKLDIFDNLDRDSKDLKVDDKRAIEVIDEYKKQVKRYNSIAEKLKNSDNISASEYDDLFNERESLWKSMVGSKSSPGTIGKARKLKNKFLSEPILDEFIEAIASVSKESPGGVRLEIPKNMDAIKAKIAPDPC
ncbi:hypothetical protein kac65v162_gp021 [Nodularia phage vB_NspS-kac65v162]|jgi:hypothetical protein|uniref:Uncharacterized protein n=6 Tax=Ravarandavirus TaxID=2843444 RepID=A0A482MLD4_9CAUD|nr:hypothetical protein HWA92_gp019 [Nodularia phage vB_NpeS-2AV2]YP_009844624.1 hypothetical protein HWC12_gp021 [Nodularia phage vB_NspS-kac65v151]YP_009844834.1 hypothetical protein HWC13_gp025 [Nodularia phage vB_NspS-kac68v161]QBQ73259.1 hypothetical protein kac65v161_gp021 [Nodularia phage vB_NspS-kac65v161]QBQ73465.1 hypothetical protein kac65v162_gp021 [Nodularia phage vB_NspS-kac65v162]QBQ73873.1 hypothetical protein kac68v162_gp025 [Nodularia phage vB_NspS-kac68v162]ALY07471.1 hypot